jgi:hypothetical protein
VIRATKKPSDGIYAAQDKRRREMFTFWHVFWLTFGVSVLSLFVGSFLGLILSCVLVATPMKILHEENCRCHRLMDGLYYGLVRGM